MPTPNKTPRAQVHQKPKININGKKGGDLKNNIMYNMTKDTKIVGGRKTTAVLMVGIRCKTSLIFWMDCAYSSSGNYYIIVLVFQ